MVCRTGQDEKKSVQILFLWLWLQVQERLADVLGAAADTIAAHKVSMCCPDVESLAYWHPQGGARRWDERGGALALP